MGTTRNLSTTNEVVNLAQSTRCETREMLTRLTQLRQTTVDQLVIAESLYNALEHEVTNIEEIKRLQILRTFPVYMFN